MDILSILLVFILFIVIITIYEIKLRKPQNKVHFYVVRDKDGELNMWFGTPYRYKGYWVNVYNSILIASGDKELKLYGLDKEDYDNLKWENEPIEVFLKL